MKKLLTIFAIACSFAFVSCEDDSLLSDILDEVLGEATINMTYDSGDGYSFEFSNCANDIIIGDSLDENADYRGMYNTFVLGANITMTDSTLEQIPYPLFAMKLSDVTAKTYQFDTLLNPAMLIEGFDFRDIITHASDENLMVLAESDNSWYWAISGSFTAESYPAEVGDMLTGTFNNVHAFHVTQSAIDDIEEVYNQCVQTGDYTTLMNLRMEDYFPIVTFNGNVESMKLNIENLINTFSAEK